MHKAIVEGNVAVVTGGASGIGLAASSRLAAAGLSVCIADRDPSALESARSIVAETAQGNGHSVLRGTPDLNPPAGGQPSEPAEQRPSLPKTYGPGDLET